MPTHYDERWGGHIKGLRLPVAVWRALLEEGITTVDELRSVAERLKRLPAIGPKMARVNREELSRVSAPAGQGS